MPSANEQILQDSLTAAIGLARAEDATVRELLRLIEGLDRELEQRIAELVARLKGRFSGPDLRKAARLRQLEEAIASVARDLRELNRRPYLKAADALLHKTEGGRWLGALAEIADHQLGIQQAILGRAVEGLVGIIRPSLEHLLSVVESKPFEGLLLRDWARDLSASRLGKLTAQIQRGLLADEGIPQIVKRLRGVIRLSRRDAETWVRTAVQHTAGETRDRLFSSNASLVKAEVWLATLDSRTCPLCIPRDQKRYTPVEHKPIGHAIPWLAGPGRLHPRDRCGSYVELKSWKELGLDLKDVPPEARRSVDGTVPAATNIRDWAERQDAARLTDLFGRRRADAIRRGLDVDSLFDRRGDYWSLAELMRRERRYFNLAE